MIDFFFIWTLLIDLIFLVQNWVFCFNRWVLSCWGSLSFMRFTQLDFVILQIFILIVRLIGIQTKLRNLLFLIDCPLLINIRTNKLQKNLCSCIFCTFLIPSISLGNFNIIDVDLHEKLHIGIVRKLMQPKKTNHN